MKIPGYPNQKSVPDRGSWWSLEDATDAAAAVQRHIAGLSKHEWRLSRLRQMNALQYMYEREALYDVWGAAVARTVSGDNGDGLYGDLESDVRPSINMLTQIINTVNARMFRDMPAAEVRPYNGRYEETVQAELQSDALNGAMNTRRAREQLKRAGLAGLLLGFGASMPRVESDRVVYDWIQYRDLFWDPREARRGDIRSLHYRKATTKSQLLAEVDTWDDISDERRAELRGKIESMPGLMVRDVVGSDYLSPYDRAIEATASGLADTREVVAVLYSWHLPGGAGADDGRYLITAHGGDYSNIALHSGPWVRSTFPVVWWNCYPMVSGGIEGMGLGHIIKPLQRVIDRVATKLDDDLDTLGHTKVVQFTDDDTVTEDVAAPGITVVRVPATGTIPPGQMPYQVIPGNPQSVQELGWLDKMTQWAYQLAGVNEMAAIGASGRGAGASALAMYEEDDRQADRFADVENRWDEFLAAIARETLHVLDDAARRDKSFRVSYLGRDKDMSEEWLTIRPPSAQHFLDIELTGMAGRRKAGRIARVLELVDRGGVNPDDGMDEAARSADVRKLLEIEQADRRLIEWQLVGLSLPGRSDAAYSAYWPAAATTNPELAARLGMAALQIATRRRAKQATLDRLQTYLDMVMALSAPPAPPAAASGPMPAAVPGPDPLGIDSGALPPMQQRL